jgi:hypothetical protein
MTDVKKSKWGRDLPGIATASVVPGKLVSGIKGAGERADAVRKRGDAFEGSAEELKLRDARK